MTGNNSPLERLLKWCAVEVESLRLSNTIPSTGEIDDVATLQEIEQVEADIDAVRRAFTAPPTVPESVKRVARQMREQAEWCKQKGITRDHDVWNTAANELDRALAQHSEPGRGETCPVCEKGTLTRVECCICDNCDASPVLTDQIRRNDKRLAARSGRIPEGWKLERIGGNRVAVSRPNIGFAIFTNEADENARITIAYELVSAMIDAAPAPDADERED